MSQTATGPNGRPMLSLTATEKAANDQQAAVYFNMQHDEADRDPTIRDKLTKDEMALTAVKLDAKSLTQSWDIPRQIPLGPHTGKWAIFVPADAARTNERDAKTGISVGKDHPAWKTPEIVENDPAWWPTEDIG